MKIFRVHFISLWSRNICSNIQKNKLDFSIFPTLIVSCILFLKIYGAAVGITSGFSDWQRTHFRSQMSKIERSWKALSVIGV